jgi:hypothetical protein
MKDKSWIGFGRLDEANHRVEHTAEVQAAHLDELCLKHRKHVDEIQPSLH